MTRSTVATSTLELADLHASLSDPLLDTMNFLNEIASRFPDAISFAPGRPYDEPFDAAVVAGYLQAYERHLEQDRGLPHQQAGGLLFQYGRTKGQIHDLVATTIRNDEAVDVSPEAVVVTVGAQEGMLLVLRALIRDERDVLLVGSPCYLGITGAARMLDVAVEPIPEGDAGIDPDAVRDRIRQLRAAGRRPRLLYVIPDFANPSGIRMPLAAREELLRVAAEERLLLLEDNPYGLFTRDDNPPLPVLKRLDQDHRVIYLGTFAKTCFPGARVGFVVADQPVAAPDGRGRDAGHRPLDRGLRSATPAGGRDAGHRPLDRGLPSATPAGGRLLADELAKLKSMTTVNTSPVSQAVIGGMLLAHGCRLRVSNQDRIGSYRARLDRLAAALERHFPAGTRQRRGVDWRLPDGGFFLVMEVPFVADDAALTRSAREHGVLWTPMSYFYLDGSGQRQLRLSASYLGVDQIDEGIRRLREFVTAQRAAG